MFRIAILGCENSHADAFLGIFAEGKYPEIVCDGVYSDDVDAMKKLNEKYGVRMLDTPDELVGKVDGIMITARHGDNHFRYAKPYMASGIPMFIDKPIACGANEAAEFMKEAKANGIRICGGSIVPHVPDALELAEFARSGACGAVIGGTITCPVNLDNPYGGFYFYTQHLAQTMMEIFGYDVKEVFASSNPRGISLIGRYESFDVTANYLKKVHYYSAEVYCEKGFKAKEIGVGYDGYVAELDEMLALLKGGKMTEDYEKFIRPVYLMDAIKASMESGKWEKI